MPEDTLKPFGQTEVRSLSQVDNRTAISRTRLSWGSLVSGMFTALAVFLTFSMLGAAISINPEQVLAHGVPVGARGIYAVGVILVALFCGGIVTSRSSTYEKGFDAIIHGIVLWGLTFTSLMVAALFGMKIGIAAILAYAFVPAAGAVTVVSSGWWGFGTLLGTLFFGAIAGTVVGMVTLQRGERRTTRTFEEQRAA